MHYIFMPFGKHKNEELSDVPESYLQWVLNTIEDLDDRYPGLRETIQNVLRRKRTPPGQSSFDDDDDFWGGSGPRSSSYGRGGRSGGYSSAGGYSGSIPATVDQETAVKIVEAGRRILALKNHPDQGGDTDTMSKINTTTDWLIEHVKATIPAGSRK